MHIALIPTDGATVVAKQIHDHEVEAHAEKYDVHKPNDDGTTTLVAGPSFAGVPAAEQFVADKIAEANAAIAGAAPKAGRTKAAAKKKR